MTKVEIVLEVDNKASRPISQVKGDLEGLGNTAPRLGGVGDSLGKIGTIAGGVALAGVAALAAGVTALAVDGFKSAVDLEAQMSGIAAVWGKTAEEVQPVSDLIKQLGVDPGLKVSAEEAGAAIEMLARNGVTMTDVLDGAARATILLSNATGGDMSNAADIMTDAMAQFNKETGEMEGVVNTITGVVNNSKFSMDDFGLALAQAGGVAAVSGVEMEDFAAAIAGISPLFASGSDAGTSFKTFLQRLIPASSDAQDAMHELGLISLDAGKALEFLTERGIDVNGGVENAIPMLYEYVSGLKLTGEETDALFKSQGILQNQFFNTDGSLKSMYEIVELLNESFGDLTEAQKNEAMATIFGTDAMRAAAGLANLTADEYENLYMSINEGTRAAENAATRVDNLAGDWSILKDALSATAQTIMEGAIPAVRGLIQYGTDLLAAYGPVLQAGIANFAAGLQELIGIVSFYVTAIQNGYPATSALLDAIYELGGPGFGSLSEAFAAIGQAAANIFSDLWGQVQGRLTEFYANTLTWAQTTDWAAVGMSIITHVQQSLISFAALVGPTLQGWYENIMAWVGGINWTETFVVIPAQAGVALGEFAGIAVNKLSEWLLLISEWVLAQDWAMIGRTIIEYAAVGIVAVSQVLFSAMTGMISALAGFAIGFIQTVDWAALGNAIITGIVAGVTAAVGLLQDAVVGAVENAWTAVKEYAGIESPSALFANTVGKPIIQGVGVGITNNSQLASNALTAVTGDFAAKLRVGVEGLSELRETKRLMSETAAVGRRGTRFDARGGTSRADSEALLLENRGFG